MAPPRSREPFDPASLDAYFSSASPKDDFAKSSPVIEPVPSAGARELPVKSNAQRQPVNSFSDLLAAHRTDPAREATGLTPKRSRFLTAGVIGIGLLVGTVGSVLTLYRPGLASAGTATAPSPVVISESTLTLTSQPIGAHVYLDGAHMGQTPISLNVPVGLHVAELRSGASSRRTSLSVEAGKILTQHVDFGGAPTMGQLQVSSDPVGAQVTIDGTLRGVTPLKVPEVTPGTHRITVSSGATLVNRTVQVAAGDTAMVVVSMPPSVQNGWVEIDAPIDLEVFEAGRHLGSGRTSRISMPAGRHTLELVNRPLSFRTEIVVQVAAGRSIAPRVPMPSGTLSISALPWAEVWVDGKSVGQTPIGNLSVTLGPHEVVWRHPEHGERSQTAIVSAQPVRLGVDWTR